MQRQDQDQTELKARRREMIMTHAGAGITAADNNGLVTEWNPAAERLFGYSAKEIIGKPLSKLLPPDRLDEPREIIERLNKGEDVVRLETERVAKDGRLVPVELTLALEPDDTAQTFGLLAVSIDLSHGKRTEEALRDTEERLRRSIGDAPIPIMVHAEDGEVLMLSEQWTHLSGFSQAEIPTIAEWTKKAYGEQAAVVTEVIDDLFDTSTVAHNGEYEIQTASGDKRVWDFWSGPLGRLSNGRRVYISTAHDITDRKRLEEQLLQSQKMEAIGTLAGGVAHDMNNVLAVVLGLSSILETQMGPNDPKIGDVQEIAFAARRGKKLVESLLGFARKGKYQRDRVSLNDTVHQMIKVLGHSLPKKVVVNTSLDEQLAAVECDVAQLHQTLMNLCLNANDALDGSGTISITTGNAVCRPGEVAGLEAGRYVKLQITDNGPGMDEKTRKRAFEPFFTTKGVGKGTGLGLSMAYGVILNHGGVIQIDSSLGQGTTINILLPAVEHEAIHDDQETQEASTPSKAHRRAKVLFVDDESIVRRAVERMISTAGYDVIVVDGGVHAVDTYRGCFQEIDLVVLDLSMPVMDGAECFEELKQINPAVRVLVATGHGGGPDMEDMIANGALGMLRKPFDMDEMVEAIERALDQDA